MVERDLAAGGAVTFWSLAEANDRPRLERAFATLGLEPFVPEPRPAPACLRDALEDVLGGPRVLVRPLATRDGFAVVNEDRGTVDNAYSTRLVARVRDGRVPTFDPWTPDAPRVAEAYEHQLGRVPGHQLSAALVKVVEHLGGTRLRPGGAIYWVPGPRVEDWARIAEAAERAAEDRPSAVYVLRHRLDADAVRAVRDAVVAEVQAEAVAGDPVDGPARPQPGAAQVFDDLHERRRQLVAGDAAEVVPVRLGHPGGVQRPRVEGRGAAVPDPGDQAGGVGVVRRPPVLVHDREPVPGGQRPDQPPGLSLIHI